MKCIARLGYDKTIHLTGEDGSYATFQTGRRTMTGARDRNGRIRCLTSSTVQRYLNIKGSLRRVKQKIELEDDKGIFNELNAIDIYQNARRCHSTVTVALTVLGGACKLLGGK